MSNETVYLPRLTYDEMEVVVGAIICLGADCRKAREDGERFSEDAGVLLEQEEESLDRLRKRLYGLWQKELPPDATFVTDYELIAQDGTLAAGVPRTTLDWRRTGSIRRVKLVQMSLDDEPGGVSHFAVADDENGQFALVWWDRHIDVKNAVVAGHDLVKAYKDLQQKPEDLSNAMSLDTRFRKLMVALQRLKDRWIKP